MKDTETILALLPRVYSDIEIQLILIHKGKDSYISSVNIIYKKKIIQKIKPKYKLTGYTPENIDSIVSSFFNGKLNISKSSGKIIKKNAKERAASNLMKDFKI